MRTTVKCMVMAMMVMVSVQAPAQKAGLRMGVVFDEFVDKLSKADFLTFSSKEDLDQGYLWQYKFAIPAGKVKMVEEYDRTMSQAVGKSYRTMVKKAGEKAPETLLIGCAPDKNGVEKSFSFGTHMDRNYNVQLHYAGNDSTKRYAYALVWYSQSDTIKGGLYQIYGPVPSKKKDKWETLLGLDNLGKSLTKIVVPGVSNAVTTMNSSVLPVEVEPKTGADLLMQLNNLRTISEGVWRNYDTDKTLMVTASIINRVLKLCRDHGSLLNADEREVCRSLLTKWKKEFRDSDDSLKRDMLDLAVKYLGK